MRFSVTLVDGRTGRTTAVLVDAAATAVVAEMLQVWLGLLGENLHPSFAARVPVWVDGRSVTADATLLAAGIRAGSTVALYERSGVEGEPRGVVELRVVGGLGAGRVHRVGIGETWIGCGAPGLSLPDVLLPPDALKVVVPPTGPVEVTAADGLEARLEGVALEGSTPWPLGEVLVAGDTVLQLTQPGVEKADAEPSPDEVVVNVNRPPRLLPPPRERAFTLPRAPGDPPKRALPWVMVLAPMVMAVPMALILKRPQFLLFAFMTPVMALANFVNERRSGRKVHRQQTLDYDAALADTERRIETALLAERDDRRSLGPDPATVLLTALTPGRRLWERRRSDPDHLVWRIGLADLGSQITVNHGRVVEHEEPPPAPTLTEVPAGLDLKKLGVVGLAGSPETRDSVARWLIAQTAVLQSPRDVRIVLVTDPGSEERWGWVRWLPHARVDDEVVGALVGTEQESVGRRLGELTQMITSRLADRPKTASAGTWSSPAPDVVVVLDGARRLRALPGVVQLLREGPAVGVRVLCLDDEVRQLPEECRGVIDCVDGRVTLRQTLADDVPGIRPDLVEPAWAERVGRALAPLRDTTPDTEDAGIPDFARLLDAVDLEPPTAEGILARWQHGRTTDVPIGAGYDGVFRLDLRRDGPHALIAGTTGSGKSELLQTIVASLAIANRPDELTFVLVDYKGGSAFKDCNHLPHTVGMVTDLDEHLVGRALTSLGAELHRRERQLAVPGAKDLEDYWALATRDPSLPAMPRLVLVIDEFASLVADLPDFVKGLVSIAQRGRSLGIHLVLATQRPTGVVSADIRANTNLRISLRVTDEAESRDVIDAPEAGRISRSTPGRGYVRTGHASLMPFQAGRVGGARPGAASASPQEAPLVWPLPWAQIGLPAPARPRTSGEQTDEGDTDLSVLVAAITEANARAGVPAQHSPWLPALTDTVLVDALPDEPVLAALTGPGRPPAAAWALEDHPDEQLQLAATFQLGRDSHLYVVGGPRVGRSMMLRTLVTQMARVVPARDLHVYALDCGNGAMLPLAELPHTGAVVQRTQTERADRLVQRISAEVARRQELLGQGGFADVGEQRAAVDPDDRLPYLLLVLDRWEGFATSLGEIDNGRLGEDVQRLLREGASAGLHIVLAGDRSLLSGRMATLVDRKLVMRLPDRQDYMLSGLTRRQVPETVPDGRGLWGESGVELQVAVLDQDLSGAAQSAAVRRVADEVRERDADLPAGLRPFRLGTLAPLVEAVEALGSPVLAGPASLFVPLGVGGDDLDLLGLDLAATPVAMVSGPPRSGRTGTLRWIAAAAAARGQQVLAICPRPSALSAQLGDDAVVGVVDTLDPLVEKLRSLPQNSFVLIDDAENLRDGELAPGMQAIMRQARDKGWGVVVAGLNSDLGTGLSGWLYEARRGRQGLLLSPQTVVEGEIVGVRLSRSSVGPRVLPGRGLLAGGGGEPQLVQVPWLEPVTVPTPDARTPGG